MKSNAEISESRFLGSISTPSIRNFLPRKHKGNSLRTKSISNVENTPPIDRNVQPQNDEVLPSITKKLPSKEPVSREKTVRSEERQEILPPTDPEVKVVVRIRAVNDHERRGDLTLRKVSADSLLVGDRKFIFDSVFDSNSTQEDIFQSVGVPLVKNALVGYNTSILSYGQTGSGKTYTMWGPPSAMVEGNRSGGDHQGIVPRIFQMLFSEIQKDRESSEGKQINYQCRCSFLEIHNEKIGDLIDPMHRGLEIKDDAKNGFYVENLTEEYVTSYDDVMQILIKGLSSRKVGATSTNSKSSRSHVVFTCIIESWCKEKSSTCFSSSRTSRISLVDLAGLDRGQLDDTSAQYAKEGRNVKKSLAQLGRVVNILAEGSHSDKLENVPYRSSRLTHLLRESLGGNAKLAVICAISNNSTTGETLSTLRFGQRARSIYNTPVINEITEDDVNDLSDKIRQLKEELIRAKSSASNSIGGSGYFKGRNVRDSLNQLRVSLNRSWILPNTENDNKEEVSVDETDVRELRMQLDKLHSSGEENPSGLLDKRSSFKLSSVEESCETYISCLESDFEQCNMENPDAELVHKEDDAIENCFPSTTDADGKSSKKILSISPPDQTADLQDPTLSESPKIGNTQRKSTVFSSTFLASQGNISDSSKPKSNLLRNSLKQNDLIRSMQSTKFVPGATESLAASLQRGLQIIDYHHQQSLENKSSASFSFEHLTLKPSLAEKVNASVQTLLEESPDTGSSASFLCTSCRQRRFTDQEVYSLKGWAAPENEAQDHTVLDQWPNGSGRKMDELIKREKELEKICNEQAAKIEKLNNMMEQYRHEKDYTSIAKHSQEMVPYGDSESKDLHKMENESKLLEWNCQENEPELIKEKCEIKEVLEGVEHEYRDTPNEKEALLKEIQSLRKKLQNADSYPTKSVEKLRLSSVSCSIPSQKSSQNFHANTKEELEMERQRWTEMESDWISLTDELRVDLESHRRHAEKFETELRLEKQCKEELDDALARAVLGHAKMIEHYADLQEKHNEMVEKHRVMMEGIAEVKRAAAKAGAKGHGPRFAKALAAELSALRLERERESKQLKKENKSLRIQLKETAEAVHAAGELLVRLREVEEAASLAEDNLAKGLEENEKLKKQLEKAKRKHKMEMITMKQYLAESRLPESALQPLYRENSDVAANDVVVSAAYDDQAWRAEFGAIYQDHY